MNIDGKVSLITGGAGGIGTATAMELACRGSDIMIIDQLIDGRAEAIKEKIESLGRRCSLLAAELSAPEEAVRSSTLTLAASAPGGCAPTAR